MNPVLGVLFHWLGGLASGSFYVPYRRVRNWSWETYWLTGGFFSWIIAPWLFAWIQTEDLVGVLSRQSSTTLFWTYLFGALWGLGGLTFGLTMRYLGLSLGMGVALGYCAAFGTLVPPIAKSLRPDLPIQGQSFGEIVATAPGQFTLLGVAVCLGGIAVAAYAGLTKERQMPEAEKREAIKEFDFSKGIVVATFSGIMSACFAFGLEAGKPINAATLDAGTPQLWTGLPSLVVVLLGGFTTNFVWCVLLNLKNRTGYEYLARATHHEPEGGDRRIPLANNYFFSALAGVTWYLQFFFYTMGSTQMGEFDYASWTLHMASIIIFSTLWGVYFCEWRGASPLAKKLIATGIAMLIASTMIIGYGAWLKSREPSATVAMRPAVASQR
ncbi:MAG: L-rhamnose/proton symporter RhaT [Lacipirellulaceae bacterium]